jgi:putative hemolysin
MFDRTSPDFVQADFVQTGFMQKEDRGEIMQRVLILCLSLFTILGLVAACAPVTGPVGSGIANPASEHCVAQGGALEIRQGEGGEVGYCVFPDGSECEEWALMRGECAPGQQANMPNPASVNCVAQGGTLEIRQGEGGEVGYCVFADGSECEEWALMRGECAPPQSLTPASDVAARAALLKPVAMAGTVDTSKLEPWELQVLDKLMQAAAYMDAAYWQQVDPSGAQFFASLDAGNPDHAALHLLMDANYGRWDRFDDFAVFLGSEARPLGSYVYPADLTKAELDAYVAAHPDEKDALLSSYTVVQRDGDKLIAVPYHEVYAEYVEPAAALLEEAAALSQNASLADYLAKQAQGLRTDDYFDADMAWLDLDSNLDISIGPIETYDDQLAGQKTFYKTNVLVVDQAAGARFGCVQGRRARTASQPADPGRLSPRPGRHDDAHRSGRRHPAHRPGARGDGGSRLQPAQRSARLGSQGRQEGDDAQLRRRAPCSRSHPAAGGNHGRRGE